MQNLLSYGNYRTYNFLDIRVNALTVADLNDLVGRAIKGNSKIVIGCHNLHSLYIYHHDAKMRAFHQRADYVHIDGMGIVLLGRLLGHRLRRDCRVTYLDWLDPLLAESSLRKWRVFYVGMRDSICNRVEQVFKEQRPELEFGTAHWDIEHVEKSILRDLVLDKIRDFKPNILFVGLGQPRQEHWILENLLEFSANVILPCGAAMDYVAGAAAAPPRWAGKLGMEWLCRLINEPRHLWRRYLIEPWYVLRLLYTQILTAHGRPK